MFAIKAQIRKTIEAEGIPYTYVFSNYFAGYSLPTLVQPGVTAPPRDKVIVLGDGNAKGRDLQSLSGNSTSKVGLLSVKEITKLDSNHQRTLQFRNINISTIEDALKFEMGDFLIGNVSTGFCKGGCAAIIDSGTSLLAGPTKKLAQMEKEVLGYESIDLSRPNIANELKEYLKHHELPLGKDSRTGITEMMASVGHSCEKSMDLLSQYMSYKVNGPCPDDWSLGQKLILRGCEPLPRRRCFAKTTPKVDLQPFPFSLWKNVSEKSFTWSGLGCKNLSCLNSKKLNKDCIGCFNIVNGYETQIYVKAKGKNDFLIDDVLAMGSGGIRVGFDIGGGSGTFAARMTERNVTMVTATLNVDAPFNEFITARGLFPLYLSLDHRFPFYDNVFDLVHVANGLDVSSRLEKLEFFMFDIDWILRAGGLFWVDIRFHS